MVDGGDICERARGEGCESRGGRRDAGRRKCLAEAAAVSFVPVVGVCPLPRREPRAARTRRFLPRGGFALNCRFARARGQMDARPWAIVRGRSQLAAAKNISLSLSFCARKDPGNLSISCARARSILARSYPRNLDSHDCSRASSDSRIRNIPGTRKGKV